MQTAIPCIFMRGGTSRGPYFHRADLPQDETTLAGVLIAAMGAGHPLQIDGIGGGAAVTSKVAMLSRSGHEWAEIDYFFAQVSVERRLVDFSPSCGNILAGVGPFAIETGLVAAHDGETAVRIRNTNTGALIEALVRTPGGRVTYEGDAEIAGVPGSAAPIVLNFMDVIGSKCGALFPTGARRETIQDVEVTCIDVAMPMVIARAVDFGLTGYETKAEIDADAALFARLEAVRREAGRRMGLGDVADKVVPKFGLLAGPRDSGHVTSRYFVPDKCHPAHAVTGAVCVGSCVLSPGTVADGLARPAGGRRVPIRIEHPSGFIDVQFEGEFGPGETFVLQKAGVVRTARKLMTGELYVPRSVWAGRAAAEAAAADAA
jgi:4-oxalomesaconate tautomerase